MVFESLREKGALHVARMGGFYLSVLVFVFFWAIAFSFGLFAVFTGWFDPVLSETIHFVHDVSLHTWVWIWGLAMLVQLYRPARRVTAMQIALLLSLCDFGLGLVAMALGLVEGFDPSVLLFFGPVFVAAALHPARGEVIGRGITRDDVDPVLLGLVGLAVVPVILYAFPQLHFQAVLTDEHAELGHYGTMVYYVLSILALGGLASLRNRGRRGAVYGAAVLAAVLGIASVFRPTMSGLDTTWSALAILWALVLVGAYEWSVRRDAAERPVAGSEGRRVTQ